MIKKGSIITILLLTFFAQAQEQRRFSLEEAVTFALDSSYTAINSRRDVAKAIKRRWETAAAGLPQINGTLDYQNQLRQPTSLIPGEVAGGDPGTFVPVVFGTSQNVTLTATLSQLIFDGSYLVALQASKAFLDFTNNTDIKSRLEVRKGVINAYGSVLLVQESLRILDSNIATLEENLNETRITFENGLAEEEDVEQLQITFQQLKNQRTSTQRLEEISKQMLNLALGIPIDESIELIDTLTSIAKPDLNLLATAGNLENNLDYKLAQNLTQQRSLELKLEKSKALPTLTGFVNYGTFAGRNSFDFFDSDQPYFAQSILGVQLSVPIFSSGLRNAKTNQAKIALEQAETDFKQTKQQLTLAIQGAKNDHRQAVDTYDTAMQNLNLAERIEGKNRVKFREGIATSFELRQAQTQLYSTQQELIQSMLDIVTTKAELETLLNTPNIRN